MYMVIFQNMSIIKDYIELWNPTQILDIFVYLVIPDISSVPNIEARV